MNKEMRNILAQIEKDDKWLLRGELSDLIQNRPKKLPLRSQSLDEFAKHNQLIADLDLIYQRISQLIQEHSHKATMDHSSIADALRNIQKILIEYMINMLLKNQKWFKSNNLRKQVKRSDYEYP